MRVAVVVVVVLAACGKGEHERPYQRPPTPAPVPTRPPTPAPAPVPTPPPTPTRPPEPPAELPADTCVVHDVELVYVVDSANDLWSFDPRKLPDDPFHRVGHLACDATSHPFSMAVDRHGVAWVLYANGNLFEVSIIDARCSRAVSRPGRDRPTTFGMGFVADADKATTESLYVAADDYTRMFSRVDVAVRPPRWQPIAPIDAARDYNPELTGTADGKLFGYFPEDGLGFVQELDRATGQVVGPRRDLAGVSGTVGAYAFAHWGGVFYVFATVAGTSAVHAIDRKTGAYRLVLDRISQRIVGAGVSTCAPLLEQLP